MLVPPYGRLTRESGLGGLGMLLESVEPVQVVHRYESGQHEVPDLADEIAGGRAGFRTGDVAPCDGQEVFGFDAGDVTDMGGRAAHFPGSEGVLGQVVAQAGLETYRRRVVSRPPAQRA